jgi:hypothetical protein
MSRLKPSATRFGPSSRPWRLAPFRGNLLATCDCGYRFNHDGMPLARNTAGTLDHDAVRRGFLRIEITGEDVNRVHVVADRPSGEVKRSRVSFGPGLTV